MIELPLDHNPHAGKASWKIIRTNKDLATITVEYSYLSDNTKFQSTLYLPISEDNTIPTGNELKEFIESYGHSHGCPKGESIFKSTPDEDESMPDEIIEITRQEQAAAITNWSVDAIALGLS